MVAVAGPGEVPHDVAVAVRVEQAHARYRPLGQAPLTARLASGSGETCRPALATLSTVTEASAPLAATAVSTMAFHGLGIETGVTVRQLAAGGSTCVLVRHTAARERRGG